MQNLNKLSSFTVKKISNLLKTPKTIPVQNFERSYREDPTSFYLFYTRLGGWIPYIILILEKTINSKI